MKITGKKVSLGVLFLFLLSNPIACEEETSENTNSTSDAGSDASDSDDIDSDDIDSDDVDSDDIDSDDGDSDIDDTDDIDSDIDEPDIDDPDVEIDDSPYWSPRFAPTDEDFYRLPWPLDSRLQADGRIDLSDFPNRNANTMRDYADSVERNVFGFSPMSVIYTQFDRAPLFPDQLLIEDPAETLLPTSSVQLVRINETDCSERQPMLVDFDLEGDSGRNHYALPNTLRATLVEGFPLTPGETYAFIVTTDFGSESGRATVPSEEFTQALTGEHSSAELNALYAPLLSCLPSLELDPENVAIASVFTIGDPARELGIFYDYVRYDPGLEEAVIDDFVIDEELSNSGFIDVAYYGHYQTPIFQEGETPYTDEGGGFVSASGGPEVQRWETVPFSVLLPEGDGPFPLLVWEDGTGWGEWGHANDNHIQEMLKNGVAVASFMPQFHGTRTVPRASEEMSTYNFTNPEAGRTVLRQEALDIAYFLRVIEGPLQNHVALDVDHLVYGGHSQGTQPGAMIAAFSDDFRGYVFSGQAAYFAITVLKRKDIIDYEDILTQMLGITSDLDIFHPTLQVLQLGADTVDPYVYATQWTGSSLNPEGNHVFVVNGQNDETSHPIGMAHLTISADLTPIAGYDWDVDRFNLWNTDPQSLPIQGNQSADSGRTLTHATLLNHDSGHFTLHRRDYAREMVVDFWMNALESDIPAVEAR